jgi:hypothetical protein
LLLAVIGLAATALWLRARRGHRRRGLELARDLAPEIRALKQECERSTDERLLCRREVYERRKPELDRLFSKDVVFAVKTFYDCLEAHREAANTMRQLFDAGEKHSLGDRIRAKDRRDRLLKDVYFSGEAALEKLDRVTGGRQR